MTEELVRSAEPGGGRRCPTASVLALALVPGGNRPHRSPRPRVRQLFASTATTWRLRAGSNRPSDPAYPRSPHEPAVLPPVLPDGDRARPRWRTRGRRRPPPPHLLTASSPSCSTRPPLKRPPAESSAVLPPGGAQSRSNGPSSRQPGPGARQPPSSSAFCLVGTWSTPLTGERVEEPRALFLVLLAACRCRRRRRPDRGEDSPR